MKCYRIVGNTRTYGNRTIYSEGKLRMKQIKLFGLFYGWDSEEKAEGDQGIILYLNVIEEIERGEMTRE